MNARPFTPEIDGTWPEHCEQRAFVAGAKWWEFVSTGGTMWQSDQDKAEAEAIRRYGEPSVGAALDDDQGETTVSEHSELAEYARALATQIDRKRARGTVILTNSMAAAVQRALEDAADAHDLLADSAAAVPQPEHPTR